MLTLLYHIIHPETKPTHKISYKKIYPLFKFHSLVPFLAHAKNLDLLDITEAESKDLDKIHKTAIYKLAFQEEEFILIKKSLSSQNIPFLSLKGPLIRKLYPSPEMRTMADLDIIVPKKDLKRIKSLMATLGYEMAHQGGNHDVYHKEPFMNVEMHRNMIDESYELSKYYINIWDKVIPKEDGSTEQILSNEDTYLFIVAHSAKHYGAGGTGVRSVCDTYFYLKCFNNLDQSYIQTELSKLHLTQYEHHLRNLAFGWFDKEPLEKEDIIMGDYLLHSGVYGVQRNSVISALALESQIESLRYRKIKYLWKRAFPPFKNMKSIFPILGYLPILLPFFYLYRLAKGLFTGKVMSQTSELKHIKEKDVKSHQEIKEKTGRNP